MNIIRISRPENSVCEQQARFVQDRVLSVESTVAELCTTFSLFTRKAARLRDANDELAKVLVSYAEAEVINKSLKSGLSEVAKTFNLLGDFRELEVQRLDKKVVEVFAQYDSVCRRAKDELKVILNARDKELSHQRQLDRLIERNPHNRHQITKAETELIKASSEVSRNQKALEEQIDLFEKRKLKDVKMALLDFIKIELALHAKAVELYTQAYNNVCDIDETQDLEELRNVLASDSARLDTVKRTSFRSTSLQSIANLFSTPQKLQRTDSSGILTSSSRPSEEELDKVAPEPNMESRIVSLRDDTDQDELSSASPYTTQRLNFHK